MRSHYRRTICAAVCILATLGAGIKLGALAQQERKLGYTDTPMLPGGKWHIHDGTRPQPRIIDPGTASTQEAAGRPPSDAVVLFDGKDLSHWQTDKGATPTWKVENGYMEITPRGGSILTKDEIGDCQFHIEFNEPTPPRGIDQGRGNSGVMFFEGKYEVQVLDSYDNKTYPDGQAAALYGQYPPLVNACRKPGEWQSYDILFTAPRFADGKLTKPCYVTVIHNGVAVHNHAELMGETLHKTFPVYHPHPPRGRLMLQDHGNPIRFRNIWYRELKDYDQP